MGDQRLVIGSPGRVLLGLGLWAGALGLVASIRSLEFGIAWTGLVPALAALFPATALFRRRVLSGGGGHLHVEDGWWWRRTSTWDLADVQVELVPTAGLMAVVLLHQGRGFALATWITPGQAERIAAWLDHAAGDVLPRLVTTRPTGDR